MGTPLKTASRKWKTYKTKSQMSRPYRGAFYRGIIFTRMEHKKHKKNTRIERSPYRDDPQIISRITEKASATVPIVLVGTLWPPYTRIQYEYTRITPHQGSRKAPIVLALNPYGLLTQGSNMITTSLGIKEGSRNTHKAWSGPGAGSTRNRKSCFCFRWCVK